jgi:glycosyltransferase involved in cell wall biosynthesis
MRELVSKVDELIIVTPRPYVPKFMTRFRKKWSKWYLDPMVSRENGMEIIRPYFLYLRGGKYEGINGILMHYSLSGLLKNLIEFKKIDLILGYNMIPDGIAAVKSANNLKLPVAFWAIGSDINDVAKSNRINYYLSQKCIENSNLILAESKDLENKIHQFSTKPLNVKTFYKGIDVSNFRNLFLKEDLLKKLNLDQGKRYILFVGRLIYDKGIYELAQVFHNITFKYPDFELILIGEEIEKKKLEAQFRNYGILNKVHFKGVIPYTEIAKYMKLSDLLVFPSWAEGLPNVVMEAMATGLPVVATDVGGIPEILENGVTGLSVPVKNVEKLTEAVMRMITDEDLRDKCITNAKELIRDKFDVKKNAFKLVELLREVINSYSRN